MYNNVIFPSQKRVTNDGTEQLAKQYPSIDELCTHYVFTLIVSGLKTLSPNETAELIH